LSLIDYEHLCSAAFPMNTKPPALVERLDVWRFVLHGKRPGARRVRRYLRRHAQRNRAQALAWGFTYRRPTREQRRADLLPGGARRQYLVTIGGWP
jgi:hypothetical protein